jgi:uncharacterized membrane protein YesL
VNGTLQGQPTYVGLSSAFQRYSKEFRGMGSSVLISILITFLVVILILYLIGMLPVDGRAKQIARIIVIVIGIISLLKYLAVF